MTFSGVNLLEARRLWRRVGGDCHDRRRTGEEVFTHPGWPKPIVVNKRRKDAPMELVKALTRVMNL